MANESGVAVHSRTIPRKVDVGSAGMVGQKHGDDLMALYGPTGDLVCVFDSTREVDLLILDGEGMVTEADLADAEVVSFDDLPSDGVVYFIGGDVGAIKIGRTVNLDVRLKDIQACSPIPLRVMATRKGADREGMYHRLFAEHRLHGEWFAPHPDILAEIERLSR